MDAERDANAERDVILVTVDSLRADHCGFMGYERDLTPTLDDMAESGLRFENAIAPAGATSGSVPAFFTGQHPVQPDYVESDPDDETRIRRHMAAHDTIPERFSRLGYHTAAFTANPWTSRHFGFDGLFDDFEDFMDADSSSSFPGAGIGGDTLGVSLLTQVANWWRGQDMFMTWEAFYDDVAAWLEAAESPYFLWIFLVDVHVPYLPGPGYRSRSQLLTYLANAGLFAEYEPEGDSRYRDLVVDAYDDTIRYTDAFLDRLTEDVDDPLVAVHADHGEELGEYGTYGHGADVHEEGVRVPLVVGNGPTETVSEPFSLLDLGDLLESLATGNGADGFGSPYAKCRNYDPTYGVRGSDWKYALDDAGEERLFRIEDGTDRPFEDGTERSFEDEAGRSIRDETGRSVQDETGRSSAADGLADIGRRIVEDWRATERERAHISDAATELGESGRV